jgi:hypothetical protein
MFASYHCEAAMLRHLFCAIALALPAGPAMAQAAPAADLRSLTPAAKARLAPRRHSRQIVGSPLPIVAARPASGVPDPVGTLPVRPTPSNAAPNAPLPVPVAHCDAGGCTGVDGVRYNNGAAGVTVDPAGRTCHRAGATIQCF